MSILNHCVFPVAGFGTRFLPITKSIPKELLPIIDKPLLQYAVEEANLAGMTEMHMIVNENKKSIQHYFSHPNPKYKNQEKLSSLQRLMDTCQFNFINQPVMKGLGEAILRSREALKDEEAFAVILPDDLCANNTLSKMIEFYHNYQCCIIAVEQVPISIVNRYGIVEVATQAIDERLYKVFGMTEKPSVDEAKSDFAIIGRYILTTDVFDILRNTQSDSNHEVQITDALKKKAERGQILAYQIPNKRYDCGNPQGYVDAIKDYSTP